MGQCSVRWLTAGGEGYATGQSLEAATPVVLKKRLCPPAGVDQIKPDQEPKGLVLQLLVPGYGFLAWSERHMEGSAQKVEYIEEGSGMWLCKMECVLFHSLRHWCMIQLGVGGALISGFALNNVSTLSSFGRTLLSHGYFSLHWEFRLYQISGTLAWQAWSPIWCVSRLLMDPDAV